MGYYNYRRREPPTLHASITAQPNGMLRVTASYNKALVSVISGLPREDRHYNNDAHHTWDVDPKYGAMLQEAIYKHLGIRVELPVAAPVAQVSRVEAFDVRYLGGARLRGAATVRTATGWVGDRESGGWKVIASELVLKQFFGDTAARPMDAPTYYGALGVPLEADGETIKKAFRRASRAWHPDVSKETDAEAQFKVINEAYSTLSDPDLRERYNAGLRLQARVGAELQVGDKPYYTPLRCGHIRAHIKEVSGGRYLIEWIEAWDDITDAKGLTLVTTWPSGAETFEEYWR